MLRVLTYHRVARAEDTPFLNPLLISATPRVFERTMRALASRYRVVPAEQVLECARSGRPLPRRAVLLTFDDAYRDFGEIAWPILRRYRLPATLFVPTAFAGNPAREFWWDRLYRAIWHTTAPRVQLPPLGMLPLGSRPARLQTFRLIRTCVKELPHDDAMQAVDRVCALLGAGAPVARAVLGWDELRSLSRDGVVLAAHTRTHPILTALSPDRVREEIRGAQDDLRREIGQAPPIFAYPSGGFAAPTAEILRSEGFQIAFTTQEGLNPTPFADPLALCRINVTPRVSRRLTFDLHLTSAATAVQRWRLGRRMDTDQWTMAGRAPAAAPDAAPRPARAVAYVMSRFPKLSETFVLYEILAVQQLGVRTEIYPLMRHRAPVVHAEAGRLVRAARFHPFLSFAVVGANLHYFRRGPARYLRTWLEMLRGCWGSLNFFLGALAILPKSAWLARSMEQEGVGHVHAHFATHPALAALAVHRLTGIPFSFTAHGSDLHVDRRMLDRKIEAAAFAVTISEFNRRMMADACGPGQTHKIHVVHCGVDPGVFRAPVRRAPSPTCRLICVASFEPVKGHRYLVEACARLAARGVDFVCHLVGDGPARGRIEREVARAGLADRVVLHGGRPRAEVAALLASSDVAVLASAPTASGKLEGIPVALMEAMASGLPVVATRTGGIPELVENGVSGFVVAPGDSRALAGAIERLAGDAGLRERLGQGGREKVRREFDQSASAAALVGLFAASAPDVVLPSVADGRAIVKGAGP